MKLQDRSILVDEGIATAYLRKYGPLPSQTATPFPVMSHAIPVRIAHSQATGNSEAMGGGDHESVDPGDQGIDHFGAQADAVPSVAKRGRRAKRVR
jgi:hypothetical protein